MKKETKESPFAKASSYAKATEDKSGGKEEQKREKKPGDGEISLDDIPFVGGLLKGLGKFIDLAERVEQAGGEIKKSGAIKDLGGSKDARGVYGFTIRTGLGQKTRVEPFGNISAKGGSAFGGKKTKTDLRVSETREPIVDVFDEKDHILIIAELPGIDEKSIKVDLKKSARHSPEAKPMAGGDILLLEAESKDRKYAKEILLPAKVDFESREMNFKNGILELKLTKTK